MKKKTKPHSNPILVTMFMLFILPTAVWAQSPALKKMEKEHVQVYYSKDLKTLAEERMDRINRATGFMAEYFNKDAPSITLYVLNEDDWAENTHHSVYGMPHYNGLGRIVSGTGENEFFDQFKLDPEKLTGGWKEMYLSVYVGEDGNNSISKYFNALNFHELGHAFYEGKTMQESINMQRYWLAEIFCSLFAHYYLEEDFRSSLRDLTTLFAVQLNEWEYEDFENSTLAAYDQNLSSLSAVNYAWYRFRFQHVAQVLYRHADEDVLLKLYNFLKNNTNQLSDEELLSGLESNVDPLFAEMIRAW